MGFLSRGLEAKAADPLAIWAEMLRAGRASKAGPTITLENALKVGTMFACLRVISEDVAKVPFKLFSDVQQPAREHQLYDLVAVAPNDWTTSFEFRETLAIHAALGNAYAFKNRTISGISELILLKPGRVEKVQKPDYGIVYKVTGESGAVQEFPAEAIWHVRGPSLDGLVGVDVLSVAREALGLAIATEESHAKLHAKGVRPSGTYSVDGKLNAQQYADLKKWILAEMAGADNAGAPMVLDNGAKWISGALTGVDAEHLATRKHQIEEICRFMRVNPQKVFHTDKTATHASAEEFNNAHREDTIGVWYTRIEQSADKHLLTPKERKRGLYFKFVANGLMRATAQARSEYYAKALGSGGHPGWMTPDEVRALEEMAPKGGDADMLPKPPAAPKPSGPTPAEKEQMKSLEMKLAVVEARPALPPVINITLNQEPVTVKHEAGAITVNTPEMKAAGAPVVNVQNDIHVPQGAAPVVNVENNIEKQDAPHVTLEAVLPPLTVVAQMPARKTHTETTVKHDKNGKIVGSVSDGSEKDA